ncbi:MAG: hypothetical protein IT236_17890 [Bacteroidia bacterium]|nr:hypothetical protein [Bacteroidia bacterium]
MEDYILFRKILELEKNKDCPFRIPVLFNPTQAEFILEVPELQVKENMLVQLNITSSQTDTSKPMTIPVKLNGTSTTLSLRNTEELLPNDYLLLSCKSNFAFQLAMSIRKKKEN